MQKKASVYMHNLIQCGTLFYRSEVSVLTGWETYNAEIYTRVHWTVINISLKTQDFVTQFTIHGKRFIGSIYVYVSSWRWSSFPTVEYYSHASMLWNLFDELKLQAVTMILIHQWIYCHKLLRQMNNQNVNMSHIWLTFVCVLKILMERYHMLILRL
jgi:hypothetical protein